MTGPLLDRRSAGARADGAYGAFVLAGCASNTTAFAVRATTKLLIPGLRGGHPVAEWLSYAPLTYAAAALIAGTVSGAAWFQLRSRAP